MYKTVNNLTTGVNMHVERLADNALIPFDERNTDYQEYLKWLAEGNEPLPADEDVEDE